ncbi:MAG: AMP-dependent synthetase/ligase, partial [Alphaproteobacteria bacterium]|nr:AMP-dependent synthetase/ligase [Alphaproteobacteria bacterium]
MFGVETYEQWQNLCAVFYDGADRFGDKPFLWTKIAGKYRSLSWAETAKQISLLSRGLRSLGIEQGDRVVLVAENRPEWPISELAIMAAGAIAVPAYTTNTVDDHIHILNNSGAKAVIVSSAQLAKNLLPAALRSETCKIVVAIEEPHVTQSLAKVTLHKWDDVLKTGGTLPDDVREMAAKVKRTDTAVIIHTSGTGGAPKGVMLSNGAIIANCMGAYDLLRDDIEYAEEVFLSFLPLSHSYEHMAGQFVAISIGAQIYYAESVDKLVGNMAEVRPTIMTAVPRLYEAIHARIQRGIADQKGLKKKLFLRALELGAKRYEDPESLSLGERILDKLLDRLVRAKVAKRFGGRLKFFVSGGAPLNYDIGLYFTALGVKLLQGYGQTEAAPLISGNKPEGIKIHTVGPPVKGVEVKIAEDGEICVSGEMVMQGYWGDSAATKEVIKDDWLHTGDIGLIDNDNHIQITDRKKDIIVNSGGDNIAPQRVEGFLTLQPEIGQAMVYGDKRPHLVALLVPEIDFVGDWAKKTGKRNDFAAIAKDSDFHEQVAEAVGRVNKDLAVAERVRRFIVVGNPFSVENGMMTPSMKIRRHIIKKTFGKDLDGL